MGITNNQVFVSNSVVKIIHDDTDGCHAIISNIGNETVYIGDENVSVSNGLKVAEESDYVHLDLGPGEEIFGICVSDKSTTVSYLLTKNDN